VLQLTLQATNVPASASCQGFAQNTGQVVSGGGGLAGATIRFGRVSLSGPNEFSMLPGEYSVHVNCNADEDQWEGAGTGLIVRKDDRTHLDIKIAPLP
jgi:hypothetical protein